MNHHILKVSPDVAQALAQEYLCIYYVDLETDQFLEYSSSQEYHSLNLPQSGDGFFALLQEELLQHIPPEDRTHFLRAFTRENILATPRSFTLRSRLILGGLPTYVRMKVTRLKKEANHILLGITNIDSQMRQQAIYDQAKKERLTYSHVAQALAADYFSIYVVELKTKRFFEYVASQDYDKLHIEKMGEDFFNLSRKNGEKLLYPEDKDRFLSLFTEENLLAQTRKNGSFTITYRLLFDNVPTYVSMKATLLEDSKGGHLIIGVNNIDSQIKQEQEYQKRMNEAWSKAKNDFLTNMSHDIHTPMNAIVGYTNIAMQHLEDPEAIRDSLEKIGSSSHLLLSMINDVLDMARIENGEMKLTLGACDLFRIFTCVEDAISLQAHRKSLKISYDTTSIKHWLVRSDEMRLEQVLLNLLGNAIKYTPSGGEVSFTAQEETREGSPNNLYRFLIQDTGVGISEEYLPHIFESFSRGLSTTINKVQGSGLGLSITSRIVSLMNGRIMVESSPGKGSLFTVELELPIIEEPPLSQEENTQANTGLLSGKKILLVEDNDINAEIAELTLAQIDIYVDRVENGQDSLEQLQKKGASHYDAVLMDLQMPVLGGLEATKAIRALGGGFQTLPIIAMSANSYPEDIKNCLEAGMNAHVAKPFQPQELLETLLHFLFHPQADPAP